MKRWMYVLVLLLAIGAAAVLGYYTAMERAWIHINQ